MMIDKEKVRSRLKDAIMLLCHTDLHFASNVAVEGLLGITLDNKDIMLISIKETLKGDLDTSSRSEPGVDTELQGISITEGSLLDTPHVVQNSSPSVKRRPDRTRTRTEVPVEPEPEPITITMSPSPEREDERVTEPAYESPEPRRKRARLRQSRPGSDNLPIVSSANLPSTVSKNVSGIQKTEVFDVKPVWGSEEDTGDLEDTVGSLQTAGIGITPDESSGSMPYTEPPGGGHSETAVPLHVQQNIFANFPMKQEPYFHHSEPEPGPSGTSADHSFKKGMDSEEVIPAPWTWSSADGRSISLASTSNVASSSVFHQQQQQHTDQSVEIYTIHGDEAFDQEEGIDCENWEHGPDRSLIEHCGSAVRIFNQWLIARSFDETVSECATKTIEEMDRVELAKWLSHFICEIRKNDGTEYSGRSLFRLVTAIQGHLQLVSDSSLDIFNMPEFRNFNKVLEREMKCMERKVSVKAQAFTPDIEEMLWAVGHLGDYEPEVLFRTILFLNSKNFSIHGREEHRKLKPSQIVLCHTRNGDTYLEYTSLNSDTPSRSGSASFEGSHKTFVQHADKDFPERCHVALYQKYVSLCPEQGNDFYLRPLTDVHASLWFSKKAVGVNYISRTMSFLTKAAGVEAVNAYKFVKE